MRQLILVLVCVAGPTGCGGPAAETASPGGTAASPAQTKTSGRVVGAEAKARCGGFGAAQAAEALGVAATAVTEHSQDITPTSRGCSFSAGDGKTVEFSLSLDRSVDDAERALASLRETYMIAGRAQESATGKPVEGGAYTDILDLGDEAVWSVTNTALTVRYRNLTILVTLPSDKRMQVAVARKILERL
jgi:hypothetical protein